MSLDLFSSNIDDAVNYAARVSAPELPSTFSQNFDEAWNRGYLVSQSISGANRRAAAVGEFIDDAVAKTGDRSLGQLLTEGGGFDTESFNQRLAKHKADRPDIDVRPITDEAIDARADEIGVRQLADSRALGNRERTTGGTVGSFLGSTAAAFTDPVNLVAFPLAAPASLGVLGTALAWGGIGAGSQGVIEVLNSDSMERIQPGYSRSSEPLTNILEAGGGAAVLGGGLKGLANLWTRAKTGSWPRSIRDAGNVVESEAQIAGTNPLPGIEGEAAHRTALNKAIDDIANGRPVDVEGIVPAELAGHIDAYHGSPYDFEAFDSTHIGTGEGAQAYGHGLYFAEKEGVATTYSKMSPLSASGAEDLARQTFHQYDGNRQAAAAKLREFASRQVDPAKEKIQLDAAAVLESDAAIATPNVYRVKITANKDHMLDWDKPLSEQAPEVQAKLQPLIDAKLKELQTQRGGGPLADPANDLTPEAYLQSGAMKAEGFYRMLGDGLQKADASRTLADAGIPGIKYFDAMSRDAYEGTRNFVVFNDKHVQITHKNGKPVNAEIRQSVVDQAAGRPPTPPAQPELALAPPEPAKPAGPNPEAVAALRDELTPAKIEEARLHPDMEETVSRDLDKLMLERPDLEVPTGVTVDADGRTVPTTRKVESVIAEADDRLAAAKEIEACVGPYPAEAAQ